MRHPLNLLAGLLLTGATVAAPLHGQIVRGMVADSVMQVPIAGAVITLLDAGAADIARTVSDENGLFLLRATRPGDYHLRVEQTGYRPSTFPPFPLAQDEVKAFQLLVASVAPQASELSPADIMGEVCPEGTVQPGQGVMIGFVRDAVGVPVPEAMVVGTWPAVEDALSELVEEGDGGLRRGEAAADSNGVFVACGVPARTRLVFHAVDGDALSDFVEIRFDSAAVLVAGVAQPTDDRLLRLDFELLMPSNRTSAFGGVVVDAEAARPVAGAVVTFEETVLQTTTGEDGSFHLAGLPAGPVGFSIRHPGFRPLYRDLTLATNEDRSIPSSVLQMTALPTELNPVTVEADRSATRRPLDGFWERREHSGSASFTTREEFMEQGNPQRPSDVLRRMGGLRVASDRYGGLMVLMRRSQNPRSITLQTGPCFPLVFMDGQHFGNTSDVDLDQLINITNIEAIEAHQGLAVPREFAWHGFECGVIVFWSR